MARSEELAVEMYAANFLYMDIEKARAHLDAHPDLKAFWMGVSTAERKEE